MTKKKVVFALNTPYALLVAIRYYEEHLLESYSPIWVFISPDIDRFKRISGIGNLPGEVYHYKDVADTWVSKIDISFLEWLGSKKIDLFVMQNLKKISNIFLISKFKRQGDFSTVLISDGLSLNARRTVRSIIVSNLKLNYRRIVSRMGGLPAFFSEDRVMIKKLDGYFAVSQLDDVIDNYCRIDELFLCGRSGMVESVFAFSFEDDYDVYFFTQPILKQRAISNVSKENYILLLKKISGWASMHKKRTLIKVHPSEEIEDYVEYCNEFCEVYRGPSIPAELFFLYVNAKPVLSCFSSLSITDTNKRNDHYWCYPAIGHSLFLKETYEHVAVLDSLESIESAVFMRQPSLAKKH